MIPLTLLLPGALAALAALVLPVVIHIARRSEQQPTPFAALRWLSERPRPRSRLRLDEWLLLLLRLLMLALVALLLARPVLTGTIGEQATVAVVPGADLARAGLSATARDRAQWLAPGFPLVRKGAVAAVQPVGSLLRELDARLPPGAALTIVTPAVIEGADGDRPRLSRAVRWLTTPGAMAEPAAAPPTALTVAIRADAAHAAEVRYLRAALAALRPGSALPDSAGIDAPLPPPPVPLVWLAEAGLPPPVVAFVRGGGTALTGADAVLPSGVGPAVTLWHDALGDPLVEARGLGTGRLLRFTRPLRPADMPDLLAAEFPARLESLLAPPAPAPARALASSYAPLVGSARIDAPQPTELRPWLAMLLAALFGLERWFATRRARAIAP